MTRQDEKYNELAPCGVYCGACPSFRKSCLGCASDNNKQNRQSKWNCKIRLCCYGQKGYDYCIRCDQFPCEIYNKKLLSSHQNDPRYTYRYEIPGLFTQLKDIEIDKYIHIQRERWKCKSCGGTIRFYHYQCDTCRG